RLVRARKAHELAEPPAPPQLVLERHRIRLAIEPPRPLPRPTPTLTPAHPPGNRAVVSQIRWTLTNPIRSRRRALSRQPRPAPARRPRPPPTARKLPLPRNRLTHP